MIISKLLQPLGDLIERFRPAFFTQQEWWFHLCMGVLLIPAGNRINFGPRYLTDPWAFLLGSLLGTLLYICAIVLLTLLIRRTIAYFPKYQQTIQRTVVMILLLSVVALAYNSLEYYLICLIPLFRNPFSWHTLGQMWTMNLTFICIFCVGINLLYAYTQWKREQAEVESLKIQTVQHQLDALKQQVNPHFLFNSLSSISSLVSEDPEEAERFVDGLAKVYRYMLQANNYSQVTLNDELSFIRTYADLLNVRYGKSLRINVPTPCADIPGTLPTLSLQVLIDNALKHNRMSPNQPLIIHLSVVDGPGIRVTNTLQRKTRIVDMDQYGLAYLTARYSSLTEAPVCVQQEADTFSVTLPLLASAEQCTKPGRS